MTRPALLALVCGLSACIDAFDDDLSRISQPRIIATIATPAEAAPGTPVRLQAIVATPSGPSPSALTWSFCGTPRASTDTTVASPACIAHPGFPIAAVGPDIVANVPRDACALFGSETPSGRAPIRADSTGGYYQPLRVGMDAGGVALARLRLRCALANAPLAAVRAFAERYVPNTAPIIRSVRALKHGSDVSLDALPREAIQLELATDPASRERYPLYDAHAGSIADRVERHSVSWFVTDGRFDASVQALEHATVVNVWHPSDAADGAWLWVVVRDDRGASAVAMHRLRFAIAP